MRDDWVETKLGDIAQWSSGGTPKSTKSEYYNGQIPWLIIGDLNDSFISKSAKKITEEGLKNSSAKIVPPYSILIALYGSIGKLGINTMPMSTNQAIAFTKILKPEVHNKYLFYYLFGSRSQLNKLGQGGTQSNISQTILKRFPFPLAPLPEQRAIVSKIEQLFSELDNGIANLKAANDKLEIYRQAVLKKAFEGELTNIKTVWQKLCNYATLITKGASPKWQGFNYLYDQSQLLFITSENVREGYIDFKKSKYLPVSFNEVQKRSVLMRGDVLFNLVGASIGRAAIFDIDVLSNINQAVALIRLNEKLSNRYLNYYLNSEIAKQEYLMKKVDVARANLSLKDVKEIEVPFCSKREQSQIVQEIETRLSVCDNIQANIEEGFKKAEALRQSILKKAFEGKLLTEKELEACRNEPDWEPADRLLERIKKSKEEDAKI